MNILLVNDDGVSSEGIKTLAEELRGVANIFVVATKEQQSGVGNAMTMHRPLTYKKYLDIPDCYYVDGTPADCVKMAMHAIFKDVKFDYVISGINIGNNLGINAIYSGTISAATEASLLGKKSIAISLREPATKVRSAAKFISNYLGVLEKIDLPKGTILNINIPNLEYEEIKGFKYTKQGGMRYIDSFEERVNPRGHVYYWQKSEVKESEMKNCDDLKALLNGYVSITPIHTDRTNYDMLSR